MPSPWMKQTMTESSDPKILEAVRSAIEANEPLFNELMDSDELEAFVANKAGEVETMVADYIKVGATEDEAMQLALEGLLPDDEADGIDTDDVSIEGEDVARMSLSRRMALQVGTTVNKGGVNYVLNENHRWTRQDAGGQAAPQQRPKLSQDEMKASMAGQKYESPQAKQNKVIVDKLNNPKQKAPSEKQAALKEQNAFHAKLDAMDKSEVDAMATKLGIDPAKWPSRWNLQEQIRKAKPRQPSESSDYESRVQAAIKEGMSRGDAQGYVEAQDMQKSKPNQPNKPANSPIDTPPPPVHKSEIFGGHHNPRVDEDPNHDGVTDRARVGVAAFDVPPPPKKIPRIPGLTGVAKKSEDHFAQAFEADPEKLINDAVIMFTAMAEPGSPATFETDACKNLSPYWKSLELNENLEQRSKNRATLNTSLHQTANAIAKNAFVKHLDTLPEGSEILVTVGGCGAGKGFALKGVPQALELKKRAAVVWDSAGDQNATENPWILQEARKRGHKVSYVYVHSDPKVSWADPGRGVVKRAGDPNDGRMVDAMVFADSYALGAKNHAEFAKRHATDSDVTCVFLKNGNPPVLSGQMPPEALTIDRYELAKFAVDTINNSPDIPQHVREGALAGTKIWGD